MSIAFNETSSRSLPGVDIRNSGSQLFSLIEKFRQNELALNIPNAVIISIGSTLTDNTFTFKRMVMIEENIPRHLVFNGSPRVQAY